MRKTFIEDMRLAVGSEVWERHSTSDDDGLGFVLGLEEEVNINQMLALRVYLAKIWAIRERWR